MSLLVISACAALAITLGLTQNANAQPSQGYQQKPIILAHHSYRYQQRYRNGKKRYKRKRHSRRPNYGFPSHRSGGKVFIFSPRLKAWAAYNSSGRLIATGRASGGASWCRDVKRACRTPRGVFRVQRKGSASCRSSRYPLPRGGAPMPYCMFFSKHYAIHGSPNVPRANVSHGCVRVTPKMAGWLTRNFITIGTKVIVTSY